MSLLSIIIPTYNRPKYLNKCIKAIRDEIFLSEDVEVIVVDDGSFLNYAEENRNICKEYAAIYLRLNKNRGMAVARNNGVDLSTGKWLVFIDDDVVIGKGWYNALIKILQDVSSDIIGIEGRIEAKGTGMWDREVQNKKGNAYLTCHLIVRRDVFEKSGKFDETFEYKGPYCEDHDLAARLLQWGKIEFREDLSVTHQPRNIKLLRKILYSPVNIIKNIKAEYYFFKKNPDRYHLFRSHPNVWGTLFSISIFHIINEFRRRPFSMILRNPLQTIALFTSAFLEQLTGILYSLLLITKEREYSGYFTSLIDVEKTKRFWNIENFSLKILTLKPHLIKSALLMSFKICPTYNILSVLIKASTNSEKKVKIYLRIDDFYLGDYKNVRNLCELLRGYNCHFLAAVLGDELLKKEYKEVLGYIRNCGGVIALHGFTHEGKYGPFNSELLQLTIPEIIERTEKIKKYGIIDKDELSVLVPPYNAIGPYQIYHLSHVFKIICGGPETLRFTDRYIGPVFLKNGGCYFPSLKPFYGSAKKIISSGAVKKLNLMGGRICITTHFSDEVNDEFKSFSSLIESLPSSPEDWNLLY